MNMNKSIYDFKVKKIDGTEIALSEYRGKTLLIVNTASRCGFTPQYDGLEALYRKYKDRGLEILAFPCNQFANQEPGDDKEISSFCKLTYDTTFPLFAKIDVKGEHQHPLFGFLTDKARGIFGSRKVKWNFTKFLVDRSGTVIKRYAPATKPVKLESAIEKTL